MQVRLLGSSKAQTAEVCLFSLLLSVGSPSWGTLGSRPGVLAQKQCWSEGPGSGVCGATTLTESWAQVPWLWLWYYWCLVVRVGADLPWTLDVVSGRHSSDPGSVRGCSSGTGLEVTRCSGRLGAGGRVAVAAQPGDGGQSLISGPRGAAPGPQQHDPSYPLLRPQVRIQA